MKTGLLAGFIAAGMVANTGGQSVLFDNISSTGGPGAVTNGRVFICSGQVFDGINHNLGVRVSGGPSPGPLSPMGTYTVATDPKGRTGVDLGTFQFGLTNTPMTVPGVAPGGMAWIQLEIWWDGVGGLFPSYQAAVNGGGIVGTVFFQNPTSNSNSVPPTPAPDLVGMPSITLMESRNPSITLQPQSLSVLRGDTAVFSVTVQQPSWPEYWWLFNGQFISGTTISNYLRTANALVITNVQPVNAGTYAVDIYNCYGLASSSNFVLTVLTGPRISTQTQSLVGYWGGSVAFDAGVWAASAAYQWYKDGSPMSWGTNSTLTLTNLDFTNAGIYSVVVTNPYYGSANGAAIPLVVKPLDLGIAVLTHPVLTLTGVVGKTFGIESSAQITGTNTWSNLTSLTLTQSVQTWTDTSVDSAVAPTRFYRVVPIP